MIITEKFNRQFVQVASANLQAAESGIIMAKTYNHLYEKIYDFEMLHTAYLKSRNGSADGVVYRTGRCTMDSGVSTLE